MGQKTGAWSTVISKDPAVFAPESLNQFDAVIMNNTTGKDLLTEEAHKKSLLEFVKGGKGIAGVHSATDAFYADKWAEYGEMMGAFFAGHPFRKISVKLDDPASPINAAFAGKGFEISDEIYTFKDPYSRDKLHILLSIDWENAGLRGGNRADNDYALSWIHRYGNGRVFYCAFGHQDPIWFNPAILKHYLAGIQYALGDLKADDTPTAKLSPAPQPARGPVLPPQPERKKAEEKKGEEKKPAAAK
jgi:type 1 glutamine amidotransferase